jgi:hypothetical protein
VDDTSSRTDRLATVFAKPFLAKDLDEICVGGTRMQVEWEVVFLCKEELRTKMLSLHVRRLTLKSIII